VQPAYPPTYPNNNVPAYPGGVPGGFPTGPPPVPSYGQPQQYGQPAPVMQYGRPPMQHGMPPMQYGTPQYSVPMQVGAPVFGWATRGMYTAATADVRPRVWQHGAPAYYGAPVQHHKPQNSGMGGGMAMVMGIGGGLVAGMLLDDLFD
jgi:hypothetical protein